MMTVIRTDDNAFRDFLFQQLGFLIGIVKQHIRQVLSKKIYPVLRIRIRIRIRRIRMILGLLDPDPDPLVLDMDPDPDPPIAKQK
jgi:hypothetical protein